MKTTDLREPQRDDSARSAPDWVPVSGVFTRPRLIAEQQHDVASFGLRFQQLATQAAAVHGVGILATLQRVAGAAPAEPPLYGVHDVKRNFLKAALDCRTRSVSASLL